MFRPSLLIISTLCMVMFSQLAHSSSCEMEYVSLEQFYLRSQVIFSGYAVFNPEREITEFKINELYKDSIRGSDFEKENLKYYAKYDGNRWNPQYGFEPDVEYIFYASYKNSDDDWWIQFSPCSRLDISPEAKMKQLREWAKDSALFDERTESRAGLIFKGKVVRKEVSERFFNKIKAQGIIKKAIIDFKVTELFKNKDTGRNDTDIDIVSVRSSSCSEGYRLGEEYIVYANGSFGSSKSFGEFCSPYKGTNAVLIKKHLELISK